MTRLEQGLFDVGLKAVLKHPRAKLWAKVNCLDNFSLAVFSTAESAVIDDINLLDSDADINWFNHMCVPDPKKFQSFVLTICHEAHKVLRT